MLEVICEERMRTALEQMQESDREGGSEDMWGTLKDGLKEVLDQGLELEKKYQRKKRRRGCKELEREIQRAGKRKKAAWREYRDGRREEDWADYKRLRNRWRKLRKKRTDLIRRRRWRR